MYTIPCMYTVPVYRISGMYTYQSSDLVQWLDIINNQKSLHGSLDYHHSNDNLRLGVPRMIDGYHNSTHPITLEGEESISFHTSFFRVRETYLEVFQDSLQTLM